MGRRKEKEETTWEEICHIINTNAKEILGETAGGKYVERESWWWNDDVQIAVKEKRDSFKKWQSSRTTEYLADYKENKTNAKKAVTTAKELYTKVDSRDCLRLVDKIDPMLICDQMNAALEKGIPSILTPLYKGKGNVTECNNYR